MRNEEDKDPQSDENPLGPNTSLDAFQKRLPGLPLEDAARLLLGLLNEPALYRSEKLDLLFDRLEGAKQLESIGARLSAQTFVQVLNTLIKRDDPQRLLPYLLTGLSENSFSASLNYFDAGHLALLKEESLLEPLQYHLMQIAHEGESLLEDSAREIENYQIGLQTIQIQNLDLEAFQRLAARIDGIRKPLLDYLERTNVALSIAWGTEQVDLIEKLSSIHERVHNLLAVHIGHISSDFLPRTGLYLELYAALAKVFDSSLQDDDRSVDGLTRLGIWHLKDYWDLGLLPQLPDATELESDSKVSGETDPLNHQLLFSQIQKQLELLGIGTIGDLKQKGLFSKKLLTEYIGKNRHLLTI